MDNDLSSDKTITKGMMDQILDEISAYAIELEEDPTQIHLGMAYLNKITAKARAYANRVQFYMQKVKRYEMGLRSVIKTRELSLDLQIKEKLANDQSVRRQSSFEDRKALAMTLFAEEHQQLAELRVELLDAEENYKIIRSKSQELQRTAQDIKSQRSSVRDDMLARLGGGEGYIKPQTNQDKSVPAGLPPPVQAPIDPKDILNPDTRPIDMPTPVDSEHAAMIAEFMNRNPIRQDNGFIPVPNGTKCSECRKPQIRTPGGLSCENGHGGADPLEENDTINTFSYEDFLS